LPNGRLIARCSRHLVAVIDGVIHDTHDSSRDGTRCVYGYWTAPDLTPAQFAIRLDAATRSKYGGSRD
jgi:hypothetical protein